MSLEIYPVFPNGVLSYDCAVCEGKCCKHGNVYFAKDYDVVRFEARPGNTPYLYSDAYSNPQFLELTVPGAVCWDLQSDGACGRELDAGESAKPLGCILFPINKFYQVNNIIFVDVALNCPLGLSRHASPTMTVIRNEDIHTNIALIEQRMAGFENFGLENAEVDSTTLQALVALLDYMKSTEFIEAAEKDWLSGLEPVAGRVAEFSGVKLTELRAKIETLAQAYRYDLNANWEANVHINEAFVAMMPTILFRYMIVEGLASKERSEISVIAVRSLLKIAALRLAIEVDNSQRKVANQVQIIASALENQTIAHSWLLLARFGLRTDTQQSVSVPDHLRESAEKLFNAMQRYPQKLLAEHLQESQITPYLINAMLQVIVRNMSVFKVQLRV